MTAHRRLVRMVAALLLVIAAGCSSDGAEPPAPSALDDDAVTVASFNFPESRVLAEIYGLALEDRGFAVRRALDLGPREFVDPALARGLIDLVPEYAGTALQFLSLGALTPSPDAATTVEALRQELEGSGFTVLDSARAQNANAFVVTEVTATRHGLRTISDLRPVARELTFGGPPECPTRPLCLLGLQETYALEFEEFIPLDAGGPLTLQALRGGHLDVALLFSTDPVITAGGLVELVDDRDLQPAENVIPLLRDEVVDRFGPELAAAINGVSAKLTTQDLRLMNAQLEQGEATADVARAWLSGPGSS